MKKLWAYLKPYAARMSVGLIVKFIGSIMDLWIPWVLAYMIDSVVPRRSISQIVLWGVFMAVCSAVAIVTNVVANRMASRVAADTTRRLRHDLFQKTLYLSCRQTDRLTMPSLISRLTSDTYNVHQMVGMMQRLGVRAPILLLGGIIVTLTLDPVLSLVLIGTLPLVGTAVYFISRKGIPLFQKLQQNIDGMVRVLRENITGVRVIKALSKADYEKRRFDGINTRVVRSETKVGATMAFTNPLMNLFLNAGLTVVIAVGALRVDAGLTQPGKNLEILSYFTILSNAMLSITRIFALFSKGSASMQRIAQVLDTSEDLLLHAPDTVPGDAHISFEHVSFSYASGKRCLTDISFSLRRGETLGIIGATGSGKSSIVLLLMRFYDPDAGVIRISGRNVNGVPPEELHTKFGVVFQNDMLFSDTIAQNINFDRGLTPEQVSISTTFAQAGEFIDALSDGCGHELSVRGSNLSGGQKQRLLISRALAANPEILILDDSSSALDYQTDARLRSALRRSFQDTTTVLIAQRGSSILHADHILVLDGGRSIGYGTHEELLENCERYRAIAYAQMGGPAYENA